MVIGTGVGKLAGFSWYLLGEIHPIVDRMQKEKDHTNPFMNTDIPAPKSPSSLLVYSQNSFESQRHIFFRFSPKPADRAMIP